MNSEASDLRIPDILTFLAVCRHGSVTAAARDLRVTPSQVSKAVARLEKQLHRPLLSRTGRGVSASDESLAVVPRLEEIVDKIRSLAAVSQVPAEMKLTVAAPPYLCAAYVPIIASALPDARIRGLECTSAYVRAYAIENLFQVAITIGKEQLPQAWVSTPVGTIRRAVFCSPELARKLGPAPTRESLLAYPWVAPVYRTGGGGQLLPGDDGCPIPREERIMGHEAASAGVAFEIAAATHQLVFGPTRAARTSVLAGRLVELEVRGWRLTESLYVHANADRLLARVEETIVASLRGTVDETL